LPSPPDGLLTTRSLLTLLQLGDSFFPSGASAFSYGLEGLHAEGLLCDAADLHSFVETQLRLRWVSAERVALLHAHRAEGDLDRVAEVDELVECSTLLSSWRLGGRRLGRALLATHRKLGTPHAAAYEARVAAGEAPGQVSAVLGLLLSASGLSAQAAVALSGYQLAVGIVGPALRLGIVGHVEAQRILSRAGELVASLSERALPGLDELSSWVPGTEIASMRQESRHGRLFAT
jgi:urease accessory protein